MLSPTNILSSSKPTSTLVGEAQTSISRVQGVLIKNTIPADKLLLALLEHAVGDQGRRHTAAVILAAGNDKNLLLEAAQTWLDHLLFPFKAAAIERTVGSSSDQTPAEDGVSTINNFRRPLDVIEETIKNLVEQREGYRCAISGLPYMTAVTDIPDVRATHILPRSLHDHPLEEGVDQKMSARSWDIIKNWGSLDVQHLVLSPANAIALQTDLSLTFKHFLWWLKPRSEANTYTIKSTIKSFPFSNRQVTFTDHSNSNTPLPDPRILRLHTALANVLHLSGAAEYFDAVWQTTEKTGVLSEDGSSDLGALLSALAF